MEELWDSILDFIEDHRALTIVIGIVVVIIVALLVVRGVNISNGKKEAKRLEEEAALAALEAEQEPEEEEIIEEEPKSQYAVSLGLNKETDGRVEFEEAEPEPEIEPEPEKKPSFRTDVRIFDKTGVPQVNVDGSKCKDYLDSVSLADFGTFWGSSLTEDDYNSTEKYLVGVEQEREDFERGDLQSVGWIFDNIDSLSDSTAIKFTNLHVIGSLSSTHVAVLCSYDWYSAFGLKDTLVVFEDMSNTLSMNDFEDGIVFSATVYRHNMKVTNVSGQRVLCIQFDTFK